MKTVTKHISAIAGLAALLTLGVAPAPVQAAEADEDLAILKRASKAFVSVSKKATPAVVSITSETSVRRTPQGRAPQQFNNPFDAFGEEFFRRFYHQQPTPPRERSFKQQGAGSGFIITRDGYILTNHHVVGGADKITVIMSDGKEYEAELIGSDAKSEVALIKVDTDDLPVVPLGDSSKLEIGEWVIAIGNPFRLQHTVTVGVVSAKGRSIGIADYEDFIQTDAAINPGNSGGPLLNINGEVIGINTAIYSGSGGYMGIGFAIPIDMAISIKDQLLENGEVVRGYLGIYLQDITPGNARHFGMKEARGILVGDVIPDSEAEKAGLKAGDVILKLDDSDVRSMSSFRNTVSAKTPGTELALTIMRDSKIEVIDAKTGGLPGQAQAAAKSKTLLEKIGISVEAITDELAERFGYDETDGVVVTEVDPEGLGAESGLRPGNVIVGVNRQSVDNVDDLETLLGNTDEDASVLLRIRQGQFSRFVVIELD